NVSSVDNQLLTARAASKKEAVEIKILEVRAINYRPSPDCPFPHSQDPEQNTAHLELHSPSVGG
ncbi:MAG: hypothetical protein AAGD43_31450, partial [Pseudomonadota bacterium]